MKNITVQQALTWVQIGQQAVQAGIATIDAIKTWIQGQHPGMSDADLNAILDTISAGAARHQALANADAAGG